MFMESLGMSYKEVVDEVPYMLLVAMQSDKPHPIKEDEIERVTVSGKDMATAKKRQ